MLRPLQPGSIEVDFFAHGNSYTLDKLVVILVNLAPPNSMLPWPRWISCVDTNGVVVSYT
jgi:hypothetical protein